jgi:predicted RND superfamily exporter protein
MMNNPFPEATSADLRLLIPLSFGVMIILLTWLVGGIVSTMAACLVFAFSIVGALGYAGYIGYPLIPVSALSPTIILTIAMANCIHVLVSFLFGRRHGLSKNEAIKESLRMNLQPIFIASITTTIGFLSLNFSEVLPFQQLGNIVAIGVLISLFSSTSLLPALLSGLPIRTPQAADNDGSGMARLADFVVHRRTPLLWGMSILALTLVANIPRNKLNDVFLHWFDESIQFRSDTDFILDNLTGLYTTKYSLSSSAAGGISGSAFLGDVEAFSVWMGNSMVCATYGRSRTSSSD